jgi:hypothetical protein
MRAKRAGGAHGELSSTKSSVVPEKITTAPLCLIEHVLHVVHRDKVQQSAERMLLLFNKRANTANANSLRTPKNEGHGRYPVWTEVWNA